MYNNSYEEYIRSVLGYPGANTEDLYQKDYFSNYNRENVYAYNYGMPEKQEMNRNTELEEYYPEIYKMVYPRVREMCNSRDRKATKEDIDKMVEEIYNRYFGENRVDVESSKNASKPKETRYCANCNKGIRDIIRILLLRELIGRPGYPGNRPPFPPPNRPPFPPSNRPPFYM